MVVPKGEMVAYAEMQGRLIADADNALRQIKEISGRSKVTRADFKHIHRIAEAAVNEITGCLGGKTAG